MSANPLPALPEWVPSGRVAKLAEVGTRTLYDWRRNGTGPAGWRQIAANVIVYPRAEVLSFLERRRAEAEQRRTGRPENLRRGAA